MDNYHGLIFVVHMGEIISDLNTDIDVYIA